MLRDENTLNGTQNYTGENTVSWALELQEIFKISLSFDHLISKLGTLRPRRLTCKHSFPGFVEGAVVSCEISLGHRRRSHTVFWHIVCFMYRSINPSFLQNLSIPAKASVS